MSKQPKVSVIIPVYNREEYLRECLDSVVNQTLRDIEIICVDDGSTDRSLEILREYETQDERIFVYTQTHQYAGVARNTGMSHASGKYLTFLDSDDLMLPEALEHLFRRAEALCADIVICDAYRFKTDERKAEQYDVINKRFLPNKKIFNISDFAKNLFQITAGEPWAKLYLRGLLDQYSLEFPNLPRAEDIAFTYSSYVYAKRITILEERLVKCRRFDGSGSLEDTKDRHPLAAFESLELLWTRIEDLGYEELLRQTFLNKVLDAMAYNSRTVKSAESFAKLYECFRNEIIPTYNISFDDKTYFYNRNAYNFAKKIAESKNLEDYLLYEGKTLRAQAQNEKNYEADAIRAFWPYRIGRAITWLPRMIRGGIRCYQEHGLRYTLWRVREKVRGKLRL